MMLMWKACWLIKMELEEVEVAEVLVEEVDML